MIFEMYTAYKLYQITKQSKIEKQLIEDYRNDMFDLIGLRVAHRFDWWQHGTIKDIHHTDEGMYFSFTDSSDLTWEPADDGVLRII